MQVWKEYEEELHNKKMSGKLSADKNDTLCQNVTKNDVVKALGGMKAGKAGGPSRVISDLLKLCGKESVKN